MSKYDRKRVARLFDDMTARGTGGKQTAGSAETIPQMVKRVAFERLELRDEDVVLDAGTGTGDRAIAAARICRQVIGIDVSRKSLEEARRRASLRDSANVVFAYGALEDPSAELDLATHGITKVLVVYSLHHLPDSLKRDSLGALATLLHRPGRIVVGDIVFFDDPNKHRDKFHKVHYDGGDTDFPAQVEYLTECLEELGARVHVERIHPLAGVITADFP